MSFVIYTCACGNYVAEPTLDVARAQMPGHVELAGTVYCGRPAHGLDKPEMRRVEVEKVESE